MPIKSPLTCDFCVIGAGSGGLSFAAGAAQMGASVILLEAKAMGGDCLNDGCVPSKALLAAAHFKKTFMHSADFGWTVNAATVNFKKVHAHVHQVIKNIAPNDSVERFEKLGVRVIREFGHFVDAKTVETATHSIRAKRFIIATGSHPALPPIPGLNAISYYTNESIFTLETLPSHLLVIGGGPIGIEMAQAFCRLGSQVTVLEAFSVLPKDEPEMVVALKNILTKEGIALHEHASITLLKPTENGIECHFKNTQENKLLASHVLIAAGRRPNLEHLQLDLAGIQTSPQGILVNKHLQSSNKKVYAIGDCTGGYQFTHVASYHAGLTLQNTIFKWRAQVKTQAIPWVTYTDPELAHVGFLEHQLISQKIPYKTLKMDFKDNDRAQAERCTDGSIKILVCKKGHILGATILGKHAGELIYPWVMAIQNHLKIISIASTIAPYPTFVEINKRVAGSYYSEKLFSTRMKKLVKWLMRITY